MDYKDYYNILGVARTATADEIKKAYRKLVRKFHPDVSKEANADLRTKELNEAYNVLGDAEKRAAYDQLGNIPRGSRGVEPPPPNWGAGVDSATGDMNDFFSGLFSHVGRRARPSFRNRGEDIHASVSIALRDAYHGATREFKVHVAQHDAHGRPVTRSRTVSVHIPPGMAPGQQLRLSGQGQPGSGGAPAGDLYLDIEFAPDPRYRVEGRDVFETVPVTPWEAALGAQIKVPTPAGAVNVTIPAGSQGGRKLRLKGRGIPGAVAGDLYLQLEVVLPPATGSKARQLYETMAREMAFDPRRGMGA